MAKKKLKNSEPTGDHGDYYIHIFMISSVERVRNRRLKQYSVFKKRFRLTMYIKKVCTLLNKSATSQAVFYYKSDISVTSHYFL